MAVFRKTGLFPNYILLMGAMFVPSAFGATASGGVSGVQLEGFSSKITAIRVDGPNGFAMESDEGRITREGGLDDGQYRYEAYGQIDMQVTPNEYKATLNNGRDGKAKRSKKAVGRIETGSFRIEQGRVVDQKDAKE